MLENKVTKDIDKVLGLNGVMRLGASSSELVIQADVQRSRVRYRRLLSPDFFLTHWTDELSIKQRKL